MTNRDIFVQILHEASGKPSDFVSDMAESFFASLPPGSTKIDDEISDTTASELLASLRTQLPGIRQWLIEGGLMVEADIAAASGHMQ